LIHEWAWEKYNAIHGGGARLDRDRRRARARAMHVFFSSPARARASSIAMRVREYTVRCIRTVKAPPLPAT